MADEFAQARVFGTSCIKDVHPAVSFGLGEGPLLGPMLPSPSSCLCKPTWQLVGLPLQAFLCLSRMVMSLGQLLLYGIESCLSILDRILVS